RAGGTRRRTPAAQPGSIGGAQVCPPHGPAQPGSFWGGFVGPLSLSGEGSLGVGAVVRGGVVVGDEPQPVTPAARNAPPSRRETQKRPRGRVRSMVCPA